MKPNEHGRQIWERQVFLAVGEVRKAITALIPLFKDSSGFLVSRSTVVHGNMERFSID